MADNKKQEMAYEEVVTETVSKTEKFFEQNQKLVTWVLAAIIVVIGGYFANKYLIAQPRAEKASVEMFAAIQNFNAEEWQVALDGDGNYAGFLEVMDNYGSTPQGSLAAHYAGVCYLKLGDKENALAYLAKYDASKGAPAEIVNAQNLGLQADLVADGGDLQKAAALYRKAVAASANSLTAPYYLKKLGLVEEALGNNAAALEAYQRIADEYNTALEARDIDSFIGRLK
ncbi:MAG: tetratricopeptide repeat protein [Tidjanibacter sp.]|nr:tetratricopeptide repeat protein [Tidjanibacter sp.]